MFIIQHISNIGKDRYEVKRKRIKLCNQNINYYVEYQQRKMNQSDYLLRHGEPLSTLPKNEQVEADELLNLLHPPIHTTPEQLGISSISRCTSEDLVICKLI